MIVSPTECPSSIIPLAMFHPVGLVHIVPSESTHVTCSNDLFVNIMGGFSSGNSQSGFRHTPEHEVSVIPKNM